MVVPGVWIDIYFKGDIPIIITGKISDLDEDQIEITTIKNEILYIDFAYSGIPEDIPIDKIMIRNKPIDLSIESDENQDKSLTETEKKALKTSLATEEEILPEESSEEKNLKEESYESTQMESETIKEILFEADQIEIGEDLDEITQQVDVPESEQRFSIQSQTNDLLDELLSEIPNIKRTPEVIENIQKMIERYKQLRSNFSYFDKDGNANKVKKGSDHKPLVDSLNKLGSFPHWIMPIVNNKKKLLYDPEEDNEEENIRI